MFLDSWNYGIETAKAGVLKKVRPTTTCWRQQYKYLILTTELAKKGDFKKLAQLLKRRKRFSGGVTKKERKNKKRNMMFAVNDSNSRL